MDWKFVLALICALVVSVFAIQNAGSVDINFLLMELTISQALIILLSALFGAATVLLLSIVRWVRFSVKAKISVKTIEELESENLLLKKKLEELMQNENNMTVAMEDQNN